jgi:NAD(P)-dependent dehydrogenase (short-subunit alcohol dehydrogenase family)
MMAASRRAEAVPYMSRKAFLVAVLGVASASVAPAGRAETVLITGANAGIGLEFATQYAARGSTVIATHRRDQVPETLAALRAEYPNVRVERMDVSIHAEIDALATKLVNVPIDILINNAAIWNVGNRNDPADRAAQAFGTLDYEQFALFMQTNVAGPIRIAEAFIGNVKAGEQKKIINLSSLGGSNSLRARQPDQLIWYRATKAALNNVMRSLTTELEDDGVTVLLFHPGGVRTERLAALGSSASLEPAQSIGDMIAVIDKLTLADTGKFLFHDGRPAPW